MIRTGQTIENPITGERVVFRRRAADTNGEAVVVEVFVEPHGFVAASHVHPGQQERFEVLRGCLELRLGRETVVAGPGDRVVVPAGTPHTFRNAGDETAHFLCEVRPALRFESLLETMFALAADGKTNGEGMPNPFRLAVIARALRYRAAAVPARVAATARPGVRRAVRPPARLRRDLRGSGRPAALAR